MPALIDLTGKTFGYLTVLKRVENIGKSPAWLCRCNCGNEIVVKGVYLRKGDTTSCGCKRRKNITGQKFGRLIALESTNKIDNNRSVIWKCKCDCGNIVEVSVHSLTSGNTKSCGCLNNESRKEIGKTNKKDLTGQHFGKLTVIKDSQLRKDNCVLWECECECGNHTLVKGYNLIHGVTKSCGCLQSKGELKIIQILTENNIPFETQKTFETCRLPDTNRPVFFDFWIDNQYLLEYDGIQHFKAAKNGWNTKEHLARTQERDSFKNQWCKEHNIPLIRIPYTKYDTLCLEDLLL